MRVTSGECKMQKFAGKWCVVGSDNLHIRNKCCTFAFAFACSAEHIGQNKLNGEMGEWLKPTVC